jgi:hypothetical protein
MMNSLGIKAFSLIDHLKFQVPNPKPQINSNHQFPNNQEDVVEILNFKHSKYPENNLLSPGGRGLR